MSLKRRIQRMERKVKPGGLSAVIQGYFDDSGAPGALAVDDPRLQQGVDEQGDAAVSRGWSCRFSKAQEIHKMHASRD